MTNYILWLAGWYPNQLSPFDGDFIQRHAKAVSAINNITVLYVKKDEKGIITNDVKTTITNAPNLTEIIIYYHPVRTGIPFLDRLLSRKKYNSIYRKTLKNLVNENGMPSLVHVHVALNVAGQAVRFSKKYNIPLMVSEHWTGYLPEAKPNLENVNPIFKNELQKIFRQADKITVVSKVLGAAIQNRFKIKYEVIPNVVDTGIFFPVQKQSSPVTKFIHVSLLNYQKNPWDMIEAFQLVKELGHKFQLTIYGPGNIQLKQQVKDKNLQEEIIFKDEVPQAMLAKDVQHSDALVLYSRYETFGCVVIEANACGIPVILSDLPVFREYILENTTGVFVTPNNPHSLSGAIVKFIEQKNSFSQTEIARYTKSKFGYEVIAKQFDDMYKALLNSTPMHNA